MPRGTKYAAERGPAGMKSWADPPASSMAGTCHPGYEPSRVSASVCGGSGSAPGGPLRSPTFEVDSSMSKGDAAHLQPAGLEANRRLSRMLARRFGDPRRSHQQNGESGGPAPGDFASSRPAVRARCRPHRASREPLVEPRSQDRNGCGLARRHETAHRECSARTRTPCRHRAHRPWRQPDCALLARAPASQSVQLLGSR